MWERATDRKEGFRKGKRKKKRKGNEISFWTSKSILKKGHYGQFPFVFTVSRKKKKSC